MSSRSDEAMAESSGGSLYSDNPREIPKLIQR
jgi:hypothetical protein